MTVTLKILWFCQFPATKIYDVISTLSSVNERYSKLLQISSISSADLKWFFTGINCNRISHTLKSSISTEIKHSNLSLNICNRDHMKLILLMKNHLESISPYNDAPFLIRRRWSEGDLQVSIKAIAREQWDWREKWRNIKGSSLWFSRWSREMWINYCVHESKGSKEILKS